MGDLMAGGGGGDCRGLGGRAVSSRAAAPEGRRGWRCEGEAGMCWSVTATAGMIVAGAGATAVTLSRGEPPAVPFALGWFTLMEALQLGGYMVLDRCAAPANQLVTWLSALHIAFQPLVINAFVLALTPEPVPPRMRALVHGVSGLRALVILVQLRPFDSACACAPGAILCGERLCTVSGEWHIAWEVPYNGLLVPLERALGLAWGFPSYVLAAFVLPLVYGAWRFVLFHAAAGPLLAGALTGDPNEIPAVWCLFSIGILVIALSPAIRRRFVFAPVASRSGAA